MGKYDYILSQKVHNRIYGFYINVARKYSHTYSFELMEKNVNSAYSSIYKIENGLLRRKPTISRWNGLFMANAGKWYFTYRIEGDTIYVEDACHAQNMHEMILRNRIHRIVLECIRELNIQA